MAGRPKFMIMDMFPYPSGAGLHVGHPLGYIATDVYARYLRMTGHNVLHPFGYDAFGLPAEQYAIDTGQHPAVTTEHNIATMRRQLRRLGLGHDQRRELATTDPGYYKWTQWIFLQIFSSWYDGQAGRARPVTDLIAEFASGERAPAGEANPDGLPWAELSPAQRRQVVDGYRLAYISTELVNWCPGLGTVLANEEVTAEGRSDIGNYPVYRRPLRQWMLRISAYAAAPDRRPGPGRLARVDQDHAAQLDRRQRRRCRIDFPVARAMARARHRGCRVRSWMGPSGSASSLPGPTRCRVPRIWCWPRNTRWWTSSSPAAGRRGRRRPGATRRARPRVPGQPRRSPPTGTVAARLSDRQRRRSSEKTGVFTGSYVVNPMTGERIPAFVADYVLMGYGTGAIMAVPAHDERDLVVRAGIRPAGAGGAGTARRTGSPATVCRWMPRPASGRPPSAARAITLTWAIPGLSRTGHAAGRDRRRPGGWSSHGFGRAARSYRLRDWLFSRQRYWGEPFPIVYDATACRSRCRGQQLPVTLPEMTDFRPRPQADETSEPVPPLARAADWAEVELDLGDGPRRYRRELNTMPQWAGSCWYYLRYLDPANAARLVDPDVERYWMVPPGAAPGDGGVDLYVGGVEHAVLHLLYARFWHKVLYDLGYVSTREPFRRLFNQGYILADAYLDARGMYVPAADVVHGRGRRVQLPGRSR